MASEDLKMSKQGTADTRKHISVMIPQKLEMIRMLEKCKS
jgi:hypothetical protein